MTDVVARRDLRTPAVYALRTPAVAVCYYAGGRLGLLYELRVDGSVVSPVWPPTGIAVASLLLLGPRVWPGIALGALLVIAHLTDLGPTSLALLFANTAAPLCAYRLLRRAGFRTDLGRLRDCLSLVFLGGFAAMLVSSTIAAGLLVASGDLPSGSFWSVWLPWWVGDAMGVLLVAPLLLVLPRVRSPAHWSRWKEAVGLVLVAGAVVPFATHSAGSLLFVVYPLLIWSALRFELPGSMLCALFASVLATEAAAQRSGPFAHVSDMQIMVNLHAFNAAAALTALLLSAVITEQHNTRRSVERACKELVEVLEHLTAGEPAPHGRPQREEGPGAR
ncbi:MASE1 domain-containing protein [Streptomyces sp. DSM 41972]|uniref:MASE1 domain-containing protein n=1 Tax=Streptomyces althioticus subsp. attaecolombicae TaxID=3075534 RepID=A0ABU3I1C9_9ACTN|nr:MASE1 domain-containing protein [Streptomyces sp. DSM 41972]SCD78668.1 Integral membrane sensor domain MASE1 [Streptomyces sp. di50b]SCD89592.1 Integral membrane sensor domain MASE1 [Streptomyces sp. di188]